MTASRLLIETMVRRTIKNLEDSPKRELRNLVDMALNFSNGNFHSRFFRSVQTMLKNENSAYYDLIHDTVAHVDEDRLVTFGMNVGYNSCWLGSKTIRNIEETEKYNIPWSVTLHISPEMYLQHSDVYDSIITQGESMGICTWQCHMENQPELLLPMAASHPNSAFILFCPPSSASSCLIDGALELTNLMLSVRYEDGAEQLCQILRRNNLLYSVYYIYKPDDLENILNDDFFHTIQQLHPVFTAFVSDSLCPKIVTEIVYEHIQSLRAKQTLAMIPWELTHDCGLIDSIISDEPCIAEFDSAGRLKKPYSTVLYHESCFFNQRLKDIFQAAFPKTQKRQEAL